MRCGQAPTAPRPACPGWYVFIHACKNPAHAHCRRRDQLGCRPRRGVRRRELVAHGGQLSQASTGLVGRVDTRSREALPEAESVESAGSFAAPELDPAEPAGFDEDDVANGLVPDPAFEPAESASGFEEPYVEYEEPGFATTADEGFTDPSLEQPDPDGMSTSGYRRTIPLASWAATTRIAPSRRPFLDDPAAGEEQYVEEARPERRAAGSAERPGSDGSRRSGADPVKRSRPSAASRCCSSARGRAVDRRRRSSALLNATLGGSECAQRGGHQAKRRMQCRRQVAGPSFATAHREQPAPSARASHRRPAELHPKGASSRMGL